MGVPIEFLRVNAVLDQHQFKIPDLEVGFLLDLPAQRVHRGFPVLDLAARDARRHPVAREAAADAEDQVNVDTAGEGIVRAVADQQVDGLVGKPQRLDDSLSRRAFQRSDWPRINAD